MGPATSATGTVVDPNSMTTPYFSDLIVGGQKVTGSDEIPIIIEGNYGPESSEMVFLQSVQTHSSFAPWTCAKEKYNAGDNICNCNCGMWDPDCQAPTAVRFWLLHQQNPNKYQMTGCSAGEMCSLTGACVTSVSGSAVPTSGAQSQRELGGDVMRGDSFLFFRLRLSRTTPRSMSLPIYLFIPLPLSPSLSFSLSFSPSLPHALPPSLSSSPSPPTLSPCDLANATKPKPTTVNSFNSVNPTYNMKFPAEPWTEILTFKSPIILDHFKGVKVHTPVTMANPAQNNVYYQARVDLVRGLGEEQYRPEDRYKQRSQLETTVAPENLDVEVAMFVVPLRSKLQSTGLCPNIQLDSVQSESNYMAEAFHTWKLSGEQAMKLTSCSMPKKQESTACAHNTELPRKQYRVQCMKEMPQWVFGRWKEMKG